MNKLNNMPNIGSKLEKKLKEVGINSSEDLINLGSKEAFLRIRKLDNNACYNMLCALEGAIQGIRWHNLDPSTKEDMKLFIERQNL